MKDKRVLSVGGINAGPLSPPCKTEAFRSSLEATFSTLLIMATKALGLHNWQYVLVERYIYGIPCLRDTQKRTQ